MVTRKIQMPACNAFTGDPELDKRLHNGEVIEVPLKKYRIHLIFTVDAEDLNEAYDRGSSLKAKAGAETFTIESLAGKES